MNRFGRWIVSVLGTTAVFGVVYLLGLFSKEHPSSSDFEERPGPNCQYASCGAPSVTSETFTVSYGSSANTRYVGDTTHRLCEPHAKCARKKAWPIEGGLIWLPIVGFWFGTFFWMAWNRSAR